MQCFIHPENSAIATCTNCGKAVCEQCAVDIAGQIYCKQCAASQSIVSKASAQTPSTPTNPMAIISLVLGILGLLGCACGGGIGGLLFGVPAAIIGWVARKQILGAAEEQKGMQLATIGLILGIVELAGAIILLVIGGTFLGLGFLTEMMQ
jgi:hypothetical protein